MPEDPFSNVIEQLEERVAIETEPPVTHQFSQSGEGLYKLSLTDFGIMIEIDRLRRENQELIGELCVRCKLPGARTYDGTLSIADFNLSSARARTDRAKLLANRANADGLDWVGFIEEFCQRVLIAERMGQSAIDLRKIDRPKPDDTFKIKGLILPRRHPTIIFGDGGAAKSYTALYLAGQLVLDGIKIALFDWELAGEDHRDRLERLYGITMPKILYARCERPLIYEMDRLRRIVRDELIEYAIYDSIAFACDGPPESAECASRYFRAIRQIGVGSLNIAHVTKSEGGDQKPFGSVFWHNGARSTWYANIVDESQDERTIELGLFNKKSNLGSLQKPTGFKICFTDTRTYFACANPADNPDLAVRMSVRDRMKHILKGGALTIQQVADEIEGVPDTVRRTAGRYKNIFTIIEGGKVALVQRDSTPDTTVRTV